MGDGKDPLPGSRRLADAVRNAKIAAAQRSDIVVDIREADRARLEILAEILQTLVDEVPLGDDRFDFTLSGGQHPRYWVDGTAHVMMARDRRTYRFVRETRLGRVLLVEAVEPRVIADRVTDYVAERIVERDKAFADTDGYGFRGMILPIGDAPPPRDLDVTPPGAGSAARSGSALHAIAWMMIGTVIGAGVLYAIASIRGFSLN